MQLGSTEGKEADAEQVRLENRKTLVCVFWTRMDLYADAEMAEEQQQPEAVRPGDATASLLPESKHKYR